MHDLIPFLNRAGDAAAAFAGPAFLQSAVLIAVVAVLDRLLRRHAPAALRAALWLLVLVKLALPPSLALPTGVGYWLNRPAPPAPATAVVRAPTVFLESAGASLLPLTFGTPPPRPAPRLRAEAWLLLGWAAGALALAGVTLAQWLRVRRLARGARPATPELAARLERAATRLGLRRVVRLRLADSPHGPLVLGLFRPVILLPERLVAELTPAQLDDVLLHELAHVRRGDLWTGHAQALLQILWWWHPLVWLANRLLDRAREEAADEAVVAALDREPPRYAETLVAVARLVTARPGLTLGFLGILERRSALRRRIERLLDGPAPRRRLGWGAGLLLAAFAAAALPMAPGPARPAEEPGEIAATWRLWSGDAVKAARAAGRPVLVNFTADWDLVSQANRRDVLAAPAVRERLAALGVVTLEGDHTRFDPEIAAELECYDRVGVPLTLVFPPQPVGPAEALPEVLTPELVLAALERAAGHAAVPTGATAAHPAARLQADGREVTAEELQRLLRHGRPPAGTDAPDTSAPAPAGAAGDAERPDIYRRYFLLKRQSEAEGGTNPVTQATLDALRRNWTIESTAVSVPVLTNIPGQGRFSVSSNQVDAATDRFTGIVRLQEELREQTQRAEAAAQRALALLEAGGAEDSPAYLRAKRQLEHENIMSDVLARKLAQERFDAAIEAGGTAPLAEGIRRQRESRQATNSPAPPPAYGDEQAARQRLVLPESTQAQKSGASPETVLVTVAKDPPHFYLGERAITLDKLEQELRSLAAASTNVSVAIRSDKGAAVEHFFRVMDAARAAKVTVARLAGIPAKAAEPPPAATSAAGTGASLDPTALGRLGTVTLEPPPVVVRTNVVVSVVPATNALVTRFYRLAPHRVVEAMRRSGVPEAAQASTSTEAVRAYFKAAGIEALPPKGLLLNEDLGVLMVRLPMDEMEVVQTAIEMLNSAPPMVQLETQFFTAAGEAGFNELPGDRDFVVLSQARAGELRQRLQRTAGTGLLTAPRVTTLSGRAAEITAGEPAGAQASVLAQVEADGFFITLEVAAKLGDRRAAQITTLVEDGQTLLARLPPAPGGAPDDAGGLILVTPTLVDPAGNPIYHGPR